MRKGTFSFYIVLLDSSREDSQSKIGLVLSVSHKENRNESYINNIRWPVLKGTFEMKYLKIVK